MRQRVADHGRRVVGATITDAPTLAKIKDGERNPKLRLGESGDQ